MSGGDNRRNGATDEDDDDETRGGALRIRVPACTGKVGNARTHTHTNLVDACVSDYVNVCTYRYSAHEFCPRVAKQKNM